MWPGTHGDKIPVDVPSLTSIFYVAVGVINDNISVLSRAGQDTNI